MTTCHNWENYADRINSEGDIHMQIDTVAEKLLVAIDVCKNMQETSQVATTTTVDPPHAS
jgi:hypothetical protein